MSHWVHEGKKIEEIPEGVVGFVYKITNKSTGKMYVGRKNVKRRVKTKVKTKNKNAKNATKSKVAIKSSDWASYIGSNKTLITEITSYGKDEFTFEILGFLFTQGQLNYVEENIQHFLNVTLSENYYNDSIGSRRYINIVKDDRLLDTIKQIRNKC